VDEVIEDAPWVIDLDFLSKHNIDFGKEQGCAWACQAAALQVQEVHTSFAPVASSQYLLCPGPMLMEHRDSRALRGSW